MPELSQDSIILVLNVIDNQCQSAKQTVSGIIRIHNQIQVLPLVYEGKNVKE